MKTTPKVTRISSGLYTLTHNGKNWTITHCTVSEGYDFNHWRYGPENDPTGDFACTKAECIFNITHSS